MFKKSLFFITLLLLFAPPGFLSQAVAQVAVFGRPVGKAKDQSEVDWCSFMSG